MSEDQNPRQGQVGGDHYKKLKIQPVEYIHANNIGFPEGSAIKYLTRWRDKGGIEDLKKAKHFIELLIDLEMKAAEGAAPEDEPRSFAELVRHAAGQAPLLSRSPSETPPKPTNSGVGAFNDEDHVRELSQSELFDSAALQAIEELKHSFSPLTARETGDPRGIVTAPGEYALPSGEIFKREPSTTVVDRRGETEGGPVPKLV